MKISTMLKIEFDWKDFDLAKQGVNHLKEYGITVIDPESEHVLVVAEKKLKYTPETKIRGKYSPEKQIRQSVSERNEK